jgi:hypothetical protein
LTVFRRLIEIGCFNRRGKNMTKDAGLVAPQHPPTHLNYEKECKDVLAPLVLDILAKAEAAGWVRTQAASSIMYLGAMELKSKS